MRYLRTNTAVIITVGPFYDIAGLVIETALTITNEKITLVADTDDGSAPTIILDNVTGATSGTANDLNYITNCDAGLMQLELAAADVNRLGRMFLTITDAANHCPVFHEFTVLPAVIYDSMILGTDLFQVDSTQILGTAYHTPALAGVPYVDVHNWVGSAAPAMTGDAYAEAAAIHVHVDKIPQSDGSLTFNATAAAQFQTEANDALIANNLDHLALTATDAADMTTEVADNTILSRILGNGDTSTFVPSTDGLHAAGVDIDAILTDTGTTLDGRIPAALVSGRMDASVGAMAANVVTAAAINDGAIDAATFAAGAITAAAIADGAIDNATFAADVQSTAYATNIIALAANKALVNTNLDHLLSVATAGVDMTTEVVDGSVISRIISNSDTSLYIPANHNMVGTRTLINDIDAETDRIKEGGDLDVIIDDIHTDVGTLQTMVTDIHGTDLPAVKADAVEILTRLPDATAGAAGGLFIAGTNAPVTITGSGNALTLTSTGANGHGLVASGNGSGSGIAGAGGSVSGNGLYAAGGGTGSGLLATGGAGTISYGILALSNATITQRGLYVEDGATITSEHGTGILVSATAGNADGVTITGAGTGNGLSATGGATGAGAVLTGGGNHANGDGLRTVAGGALALDIDSAALTAVLADTNELQTDWVNSGRLDLLLDATALATELAKVPKSDSNVSWNATALGAINAEVDTALNTAIPGSPTANSINERVAAIDDLTQASGGGDLAAILTDTGTTIPALLPAALVSGRMDASVGAVANNAITAAAIATNAIDADALAADAVDEILDEVVEGTLTMRQMLRLFTSVLAGKAAGGGSATITFQDVGDTKARVTMTVDSSGNRSAVTLDGA